MASCRPHRKRPLPQRIPQIVDGDEMGIRPPLPPHRGPMFPPGIKTELEFIEWKANCDILELDPEFAAELGITKETVKLSDPPPDINPRPTKTTIETKNIEPFGSTASIEPPPPPPMSPGRIVKG